jgi:hypothetical protein
MAGPDVTRIVADGPGTTHAPCAPRPSSRPLRLSLALALAPAFDRAITAIGERLNVSKGAAFGVFLFCMAVVTTTTLFGSLYLLGGFPPVK